MMPMTRLCLTRAATSIVTVSKCPAACSSLASHTVGESLPTTIISIGNLNNIASPPRIPLTLDNSRPYFTQVAVFQTHNSNGTFSTGLTYGGGSFGKPVSLDVTGPKGFHVTYPNVLNCFPGNGGLCTFPQSAAGAPADGIYTFKVTDSDNNTAVSYFHLSAYGVPSSRSRYDAGIRRPFETNAQLGCSRQALIGLCTTIFLLESKAHRSSYGIVRDPAIH